MFCHLHSTVRFKVLITMCNWIPDIFSPSEMPHSVRSCLWTSVVPRHVLGLKPQWIEISHFQKIFSPRMLHLCLFKSVTHSLLIKFQNRLLFRGSPKTRETKPLIIKYKRFGNCIRNQSNTCKNPWVGQKWSDEETERVAFTKREAACVFNWVFWLWFA